MLKYENIAHDIQRSIESGTLKPGEKLPTVVELCDLYSVSKITVKHAMDYLIEAGLVTSRRGSGTYVKNVSALPEDPLRAGVSDRAQGFSAEHSDHPDKVTTVVYDFEIVNPAEDITRRLGISSDDFTYYDCRTRLLDGVPISIEHTYMPLDLLPGLKRRHVGGSIYAFIQNELGLKIANFHRAIRAVPATEQEAERLACAPGDPLLEFEQIGYLDNSTPFEYSISRSVGSRYTLNNIVLA